MGLSELKKQEHMEVVVVVRQPAHHVQQEHLLQYPLLEHVMDVHLVHMGQLRVH
jgi:hypothetical protein